MPVDSAYEVIVAFYPCFLVNCGVCVCVCVYVRRYNPCVNGALSESDSMV
jgi:hypothetical protein